MSESIIVKKENVNEVQNPRLTHGVMCIGVITILGLMTFIIVFAIASVLIGVLLAEKAIETVIASNIGVSTNPSTWIGYNYLEAQKWATETGRIIRIASINGRPYSFTRDITLNRVTLELKIIICTSSITDKELFELARLQPYRCIISSLQIG